MAKDESQHSILEVLIHIMAWMVVFFFPQMMFVREEGFMAAVSHMLPLLVSPALLAVVFYANYLWLVPRVLDSRNIRRFAVVNVLLIMVMQTASGLWSYSCLKCIERAEVTRWENEGMHDSLLVYRYGVPGAAFTCPHCGQGISPDSLSGHPRVEMCVRPVSRPVSHGGGKRFARRFFPGHPMHRGAYGWAAVMVVVRDFFTYLLLVALAVVLHMSFRFRKAEMARKQAEYRRTETELQSLKNQVSPHFLLNTLNNIYALVFIDQAKAQEAILNLSRLLSHMLYQNRDTYTTLDREVDFLRRYVDLMRLRVSSGVKVEFTDNVQECGMLPIAPLIYISLVENAFKHGISGNEGHIGIRIIGAKADGIICADIRNSNHPKSPADKSGHGVGLELVRRRLELLYPGRYDWQQGVDAEHNEYYSILNIHTR